MSRIFFGLALVSFLLLVTNLVIGLITGDYGTMARDRNAARRELQEARKAPGNSRANTAELERSLAEKDLRFKPVQERMAMHFWIGVIATLFTVLINSVSVTYFIGTARWCKEVVDTYSLNSAFAEESNTLKRRTFPWSLGSILLIIVVAALGGAADQAGALGDASANWVLPHFVIALFATAFIGWSYLVQVNTIAANFDTIEKILHEVDQIRAQRAALQPPSESGVGQGGAVG